MSNDEARQIEQLRAQLDRLVMEIASLRREYRAGMNRPAMPLENHRLLQIPDRIRELGEQKRGIEDELEALTGFRD